MSGSRSTLEKVSLSQMKAQFARELKMMIENELQQQKLEIKSLGKIEYKTRRMYERENVTDSVKSKKNLSV